MTAPVLSVVLPCRNQEDHIGAVLRSYAEPLSALGQTYELVAVPNACTDGTAAAVAAVAREDPRVRMIENPAGGWGLSVITGLRAARGAILCYTNSARTDPAHVTGAFELYRRNVPSVVKVRRSRREAPVRELGSWLYNLEGRILFGIGAGDVNGTPKVFSRETWERLQLFSPGDLLDLELLAKAVRLRLPVVELEVEGFKRHGGRSSTNLRSAWRMYLGAVRLRMALARSNA